MAKATQKQAAIVRAENLQKPVKDFRHPSQNRVVTDFRQAGYSPPKTKKRQKKTK